MQIKNICKQQGISMEQLSEKSGISLTYLYEINRGVKNPTVKVAIKIANALSVDIKALLDTA